MLYFTSMRNWHIWLGTLLSLPLLIIGLTAVFFAHGKDLGLKDIPMNLAWLPGYQMKPSTNRQSPMEIRTTFRSEDGHYFLGTRFGLYQLGPVQQGNPTGEQHLRRVEAFPATEVRSIQPAGKDLLIASKKGVWQGYGSQWRQLYKGESWHAERISEKTFHIAVKEKGILKSTDGGIHWAPVIPINTQLAALPLPDAPEESHLGRLIFDLHTGKALFGKQYEWIWIDLAGLTVSFLTLSGLTLWHRSQKIKTRLQG